MQVVSESKFCVNCVHHDTDKAKAHICRREQSKKVNLVTGLDDWAGTVRNCRDERILKGPNTTNQDPCMAEGVHYQAKKK